MKRELKFSPAARWGGFLRIRLAVQVSEEYWVNRERAHAGNDGQLVPLPQRTVCGVRSSLKG
jgi:hypothetical protein